MKKYILILSAVVLISAGALLFQAQSPSPEAPNQSTDETPRVTESTAFDPSLAQCPGERAFNRQSYKTAFREFSERAGSDASAQYHLGLMYEKGLAVIPDPHKAMRWLLKAAEENHVNAIYALGRISLEGRILPKNYSESFKWFQQAAQLDHPESQYHLGTMYRDGRGIESDELKAHGWLTLAAKNGFQPAEQLIKNFNPDSAEAEKVTEKLQGQVTETVRNTVRPRGPACAQ